MTAPDADRGGLSAAADSSIGLGGAAALPNPAIPVERPEDVGPPSRRRFRFGSGRTFSALANRDFRYLLIGNFFQFGAMQMQMLVRGVLVYDLTGSFAALGLVALANAVPGLLFSLVGGVVADRAPKKTMIQIAQLTNLINAAVLAVLAGMGVLSFSHLMISAVLQGGINAVMMPSRQSIIVDLVGRERLTNAIALNTSVQNVMQLVGPGLGGALLAFLSPAAVFWLMTALYGAAIGFTVQLPKHPVYAYDPRANGGGRRRPGGIRDIAQGLKYVAVDPTVRTLILVNFVIVVVAFPYQMMLPGFVHEVLKKGPAAQGLLMSASGVGAIAGSLVVASMRDKGRGRLMIGYGMLIGGALLAFAISTNILITLPIMVILGTGMSGRMSTGQALIQSYSADEFRGRVTAVWLMQFSIVQFGTFGVGILSELVGPQMAIGGLAVTLIITMAVVYLFVPRIRNLE
jgi:MFS family permease